MKESCNSSGEGTKEEGEKGGTEAAAGELPVIGGSIGGEGVGDGCKNRARKAVEETPESTGKVFWGKGGKDGNEKADRGVGEKKTSGEESSSVEGESLEPWPKGGEKPEEATGPDGAP